MPSRPPGASCNSAPGVACLAPLVGHPYYCEVTYIELATEPLEHSYERVLQAYCETGTEESLYEASILSQQFIAAGIRPDEIVAIHVAGAAKVVDHDDSRCREAAQQLLLEVMIAYGVRYSEYAEVRYAVVDAGMKLEQARAEIAERTEQEHLALLASISHEWGTPLTVIKGNVSAIRRHFDANEVTPELLSCLADVELSLQRMLSLREDLMAASRSEVPELDAEPIHMGHCLERAVRWVRPSADEKGLSLAASMECEAPYVFGDGDAMQSILGNLLSNAVRYTPRDGAITVTCTQDSESVVVVVSDTGIGLSEEASHRIFERFYRAPEGRAAATFGLGLGLSLTRSLVEAQGGSVHAKGAPNEGSTFTVTFPIAKTDETEDN